MLNTLKDKQPFPKKTNEIFVQKLLIFKHLKRMVCSMSSGFNTMSNFARVKT